MLVGADALDGAHRARPKPRARAVGDAQIHRHADEREIQAAEIGQVGRLGTIGRTEQGGDIGERPFAAVAARKLQVGDSLEMLVVDLAAGRVTIALAQALELCRINHRASPVQAA